MQRLYRPTTHRPARRHPCRGGSRTAPTGVWVVLHRWAAFSFVALLGFHGPGGLGDGFETAPGDLISRVVADAVGSLFYLLQRLFYFSEAALDSFLHRGVHLAVKDGLAHVAGVGLGEVVSPALQLALVLVQPVAYPHEFVPQGEEPLLLVVDKLLVQRVDSQDPSITRNTFTKSPLPYTQEPRFPTCTVPNRRHKPVLAD